jgi:hypothetical protein
VMETPWLLPVRSAAPRQRSPQVPFDLCGVIADAPDFCLRTKAPLPAASVRMLGGRNALLFAGPLTNDGALIGRDGAAYRCVRDEGPEPLEGLYAVWISGPAGTSLVEGTLRVTTPATRLDPLARVGEPPAGLALEGRALRNWYPDFSVSEHQALWLQVPASLVAFHDGMPVLILSMNRVEVDDDPRVVFNALFPGGSVRQVNMGELSTQASTLVAPKPERADTAAPACARPAGRTSRCARCRSRPGPPVSVRPSAG